MYILYAGINGANPRYIERPAIKTACQELTQMKSFGSPEIGGIDRTSEKNNIDCRNYFSDFNIYRQRICSYKSWTSKCRICRSTKDLDYDMFRILSKRKITFTKIFQISNGNTFPKTQKNLNPLSEKPKATPGLFFHSPCLFSLSLLFSLPLFFPLPLRKHTPTIILPIQPILRR